MHLDAITTHSAPQTHTHTLTCCDCCANKSEESADKNRVERNWGGRQRGGGCEQYDWFREVVVWERWQRSHPEFNIITIGSGVCVFVWCSWWLVGVINLSVLEFETHARAERDRYLHNLMVIAWGFVCGNYLSINLRISWVVRGSRAFGERFTVYCTRIKIEPKREDGERCVLSTFLVLGNVASEIQKKTCLRVGLDFERLMIKYCSWRFSFFWERQAGIFNT